MPTHPAIGAAVPWTSQRTLCIRSISFLLDVPVYGLIRTAACTTSTAGAMSAVDRVAVQLPPQLGILFSEVGVLLLECDIIFRAGREGCTIGAGAAAGDCAGAANAAVGCRAKLAASIF